MMKGLEVCCPECGTIFDLADQEQADLWIDGHDCEVEE